MLLDLPEQLPRDGRGLLFLPLGPASTVDQKFYALCFAAGFCQDLTVVADDLQPVANELKHIFAQLAAAVSPDIVIDFARTDYARCDFVFGLRPDARDVARAIDGQFIPINIDKEISGFGLNGHLAQAEKTAPSKICIIGPESTGKSTLARDLARHFNATLVPEYAREHLTYRGTAINAGDIELIARGQVVSQSILAAAEKNILIADSDLLTTSLYAEALFAHCPPWIEELSRQPDQTSDLYLLTCPDVPWVEDAHRVDREGRAKFFEGCQQKLIAMGLPYVLIEGDWQKRFEQSVKAVNELRSLT